LDGVQLLKLRKKGVENRQALVLGIAVGIAVGTAHHRFGRVARVFRDVDGSHEATPGEQFLALQLLEVW
jgi:hypothetical protein